MKIKRQRVAAAACIAVVISALFLIAALITTGQEASTPLFHVGVGFIVAAITVLLVTMVAGDIQDSSTKRGEADGS